MLRPSLIVHGDHQAESLARCLWSEPAIAERYEVAFSSAGQGPAAVAAEVWRRCAVFWRQLGDGGTDAPTARALLDPRCRVVTFPTLRFTAPWPHRLRDPLMDGQGAGGFAYSDRTLVRLAATGLTGAALMERYLEMDAALAPAMRRMLDRALHRLIGRDRGAGIAMGGFIAANFRSQRLFAAAELPTPALMRELLRRLVLATWPDEVRAGDGLDRLHAACRQFDPLRTPRGLIRRDDPISPAVAAALGLAWWSPDDAYLVPASDGAWRAWLLPEFVDAHVSERRRRLAGADRPQPPPGPPPPATPSAKDLLARSHALLKQGDAEGAIAAAEAACAAGPEDIACAVHFAYLLVGSGAPERAEAACRRALELAPGDPGANHAFSLLCTRTNRMPEAVAAARVAALAAPGSVHTAAHLGNLLRRTGDFQGAEAAYRLAIAAAPRSADLHMALAELYAGAGFWQDAAASARRSVGLAPEDARAAALLARIEAAGALAPP